MLALLVLGRERVVRTTPAATTSIAPTKTIRLSVLPAVYVAKSGKDSAPCTKRDLTPEDAKGILQAPWYERLESVGRRGQRP
eukprot:CAMPEP_0205898298 /NCGR_PEP_ID=MMETSP1083-20121108/25977_1 /ASSEMBLY_ACC=CAM_ASM_000430 /TAXON_ID=97485 /ORGANISM="Prymnesium parvum, Strain Texoma1" /LENGTH=81 /DNA_ID=CAMNT_0053263557 /DNA_START=308 /DNA_END=550 /DNA_ORIENTATION=+